MTMTDKWNLVIDIDKCNGCYNCSIAAKDEYVGNNEPGYFAAQPRHGQEWIAIQQKERGEYPVLDVSFLPVMCNHCDDAPCMKVARDGAVRKRPDGIVIIDPEKAKGQRAIVNACPYGAVFWNDTLQLPQHWPFDAHLLDRGWKAPRCVEVCATGAITAVKASDQAMQQMARDQELSVRNPEFRTKPRVYYRNLKRTQSEFIAGTVVTDASGVVDCAAGAQVTLFLGDTLMASAQTDEFGDFRFDGLPSGSGPYLIVIKREQVSRSIPIERLEGSRSIGRFAL
jgi:Fe-S-cluster-containing dehydrogenase component